MLHVFYRSFLFCVCLNYLLCFCYRNSTASSTRWRLPTCLSLKRTPTSSRTHVPLETTWRVLLVAINIEHNMTLLYWFWPTQHTPAYVMLVSLNTWRSTNYHTFDTIGSEWHSPCYIMSFLVMNTVQANEGIASSNCFRNKHKSRN